MPRPRLYRTWVWMVCGMGLVAVAVWERRSLLQEGLWRDEAAAVYVARSSSIGEFVDRQLATEYTPPLFNALLAVYGRVAGVSEMSLKAFALVLGILAIAALAALAWNVFGGLAWLPATVLVVGNPVLFPLFVELRPYSLSVMLTAVSLLVSYRILTHQDSWDRQTWSLSLALGVCFVLLAYSHVGGALALIIAGLVAAALMGRQSARILVPTIAAGILFLPWVSTMVRQARAGLPYEPSLTFGQHVASLARRLILIAPSAGASWVFPALLGASALAMALSARFRAEMRRNRVGLLLTSGVLVGVALPLGLFSSTDRYMAIPAALGCVAAAGVIVAGCRAARQAGALTHRLITIALIVVLGVSLQDAGRLSSDFGSYIARGLPKSGMRTVCAGHRFGTQDMIVVAPDYLASTLWYYCSERATMRGIVLWENALMVNWQDYGKRWVAPGMVANALDRIDREIATRRPARLVLIGDISSNGPPLYYTARIERLRRALHARFPFASTKEFEGRLESVLVDEFEIGLPPAPGDQPIALRRPSDSAR